MAHGMKISSVGLSNSHFIIRGTWTVVPFFLLFSEPFINTLQEILWPHTYGHSNTGPQLTHVRNYNYMNGEAENAETLLVTKMRVMSPQTFGTIVNHHHPFLQDFNPWGESPLCLWSIPDSFPINRINSTATVRALVAARELNSVEDHVSSPPAKSDTPRNTIAGTPEDIQVCRTETRP